MSRAVLLILLLVSIAAGQTVQYGGRLYNGPVCRNPRCAMCNQIKAMQAQARMRVVQPTFAPIATQVIETSEAGTAELDADAITEALALLRLGPGDVFADIGCGRGHVLIEAVRRYGCRAVGIEIDAGKYRQAEAAVDAAERSGKIPAGSIDLVLGDARQWNPAGVTKAIAYLWPDTLSEVWPAVSSIPLVVVPYHDVPGVAPTRTVGAMAVYEADQWEPTIALAQAEAPTQTLPKAPAARKYPRVLVVVTDTAICAPCRRLAPELRKLRDTVVVEVRQLTGFPRIPTLIYHGHVRTGYATSVDIEQWMTEAEK